MELMMQEKARWSYNEAQEQLEESLSKISMECRCRLCWLDKDPDPKGHTGKSNERMASKEWFCLTTLATTIVRLFRVLTAIDLENKKLFLKRRGAEWVYNQQKFHHQRQRQMAKT